MIFLQMFYYLIGIVCTLVVGYAFLLYIKDLNEDWHVYREGIKCSGYCTHGFWRGKDFLLNIEWLDNNNIPHMAEVHGLRKMKKYPYQIIVYSNDTKANMGLYTVIYDFLNSTVLLLLFIFTPISFFV